MDLTWRTAAWDATGKQTDPPAFLYHADRSAFAVQISQAPGNDRMNFVREKHCRVVQSEEEWDDYLEEVVQPDSASTGASLSLVIFPRHPDTGRGNTIRNPSSLKQLPIPSEAVFKRLVDKFQVHQAIQRLINRGWPAIVRSEDQSGGTDRKIYYNLRTTNTLPSDTALTLTHLPSRNRTYAILFGYTPRQAASVLERLAYATTTATTTSSPSSTSITDPLMLLTTFIQLEKVIRFEHVERRADAMADLVRNFSLGHGKKHGHADDPRDLVGLAADMTGLRNGLVGWKREVERFRERMGKLRGGLGREEEREYLKRTADEYGSMVRRCEGLLGQVGMAFQMETASIARQEVDKMKGIAVLTMVFLPATFAATFMSMGLFNWHPQEGESVLSPWWYVYFIVTGGLTAVVFLIYFFWSRISEAVYHFREDGKSDQSIC